MKFLVDTCISRYAVEALREKGYDTVWIAEGKNDPGDTAIMKRAFEEERIIITADKDFGDLIFVFKLQHRTIIRLANIKAIEQGKIILHIIEKYSDEFIKNPLITIEKTRIRINYSEGREN